MYVLPSCWHVCFFFFNDTATTEIYPLSLHDALPISRENATRQSPRSKVHHLPAPPPWRPVADRDAPPPHRSANRRSRRSQWRPRRSWSFRPAGDISRRLVWFGGIGSRILLPASWPCPSRPYPVVLPSRGGPPGRPGHRWRYTGSARGEPEASLCPIR